MHNKNYYEQDCFEKLKEARNAAYVLESFYDKYDNNKHSSSVINKIEESISSMTKLILNEDSDVALEDVTNQFKLNFKGRDVKIYRVARPDSDRVYYIIDDGEHLGRTTRRRETAADTLKEKGFIGPLTYQELKDEFKDKDWVLGETPEQRRKRKDEYAKKKAQERAEAEHSADNAGNENTEKSGVKTESYEVVDIDYKNIDPVSSGFEVEYYIPGDNDPTVMEIIAELQDGSYLCTMWSDGAYFDTYAVITTDIPISLLREQDYLIYRDQFTTVHKNELGNIINDIGIKKVNSDYVDVLGLDTSIDESMFVEGLIDHNTLFTFYYWEDEFEDDRMVGDAVAILKNGRVVFANDYDEFFITNDGITKKTINSQEDGYGEKGNLYDDQYNILTYEEILRIYNEVEISTERFNGYCIEQAYDNEDLPIRESFDRRISIVDKDSLFKFSVYGLTYPHELVRVKALAALKDGGIIFTENGSVQYITKEGITQKTIESQLDDYTKEPYLLKKQYTEVTDQELITLLNNESIVRCTREFYDYIINIPEDEPFMFEALDKQPKKVRNAKIEEIKRELWALSSMPVNDCKKKAKEIVKELPISDEEIKTQIDGISSWDETNFLTRLSTLVLNIQKISPAYVDLTIIQESAKSKKKRKKPTINKGFFDVEKNVDHFNAVMGNNSADSACNGCDGSVGASAGSGDGGGMGESLENKYNFVAKQFNYTYSYGGKPEFRSAAVIIIPDALSFNGQKMDATIFAEDEDGNEIDFRSVAEAQNWIDSYGDNVTLHVEHGDEIHATPNRLQESLNESVLKELRL